MRRIGASRFAPLVGLVGKPSQRPFLIPQCCEPAAHYGRTSHFSRNQAPCTVRLPARLVSVSCSLRRFIPLSPGRLPRPFRSAACCPCIACQHRNSIGCVQTSVLGAVAAWTIAGRGALARAPRGNDEQAKGVCKGKHSETEGRSRGQPCLMMVGELVQRTRTLLPVQGCREEGSQGVTHGTTAPRPTATALQRPRASVSHLGLAASGRAPPARRATPCSALWPCLVPRASIRSAFFAAVLRCMRA